MADRQFHAEDAIQVQRELRRRLGLEEALFPLSTFVAMISDEIDLMRTSGFSDVAIADIISHLTGKSVQAAQIAEHYVRPEERLSGNR